MKEIEILIGDSQYLTRSGLERLITSDPTLKLIGQQKTGRELLRQATSGQADVVILDYNSDNFTIEVIKEIKSASPDTNVLVISADLNHENIFRAIELGANSFVTKNCSEQEIINAIIATSKNERFFCNRVLEVFISKEQSKPGAIPTSELSDREVEILQLIGKGYSTKELATLLHLSRHTIYTHRKNMMKKLGVNSSTDLILSAVNLGLIKPTQKTA